MIKKSFALLMALMLLISVMPLAVAAEETCADGHTPVTEWSSNSHVSMCSVCHAMLGEPTAHTLVNGACTGCDYVTCADGHTPGAEGFAQHMCSVCGARISSCEGYANDCTCDICESAVHQGRMEKNAEGHRFACELCDYAEEWAAHVDNNGDGACDSCGYGCQHTGTVTWGHSGSGHWGNCSGCYTQIVAWEEHTMVDNKCTVCGYAPCTDAHSFGTVGYERHICQICSYISGCIGFEDNCICDICGDYMHMNRNKEVNETQHHFYCTACGLDEGWVNHSDTNGDGACDSCGYGCQHVDTVNWSYDQTSHYSYCYSCGNAVTDWEDHTMEGNVCTVCGYAPCANGDHQFVAGNHKCVNCDYYTYCEDTDGDCICDTCTAGNTHTDMWDLDETGHGYVCANCEYVYWWEAHSDPENNGFCEYCGYGCDHDAEPVWGWNDEIHAELCGKCYTQITDGEAHTFVDDVCTVCGYETESGEDNIPKDGDPTIIVMGITLSLACATAFVSRKKEN